MQKETIIALVSSAGTLLVAALGLFLKRWWDQRDKASVTALGISVADIDSKDKFIGHLMKRVTDLEAQVKEQQVKMDDMLTHSAEREGRIAKLEFEQEKAIEAMTRMHDENRQLGLLRRVFERELRKSELLRAVFDATSTAIIMANSKGVIVAWNAAATQLFGYEEWEALGRPVEMLIPERFRSAHHRAYNRTAETGILSQPAGFNIDCLKKSGETVKGSLQLTKVYIESELHIYGTVTQS
jgi:PAS domain S-box-containing protein